MSHVLFKSAGGRDLLVAFSGLSAVPRGIFEWQESSRAWPGPRLFFRDPNNAYYLKGVSSVLRSGDDVVSYVSEVVRQLEPRRVMVLGTSVGSYLALIAGWCIRADVVHILGPRVDLLPEAPEESKFEMTHRSGGLHLGDASDYLALDNTKTKFHLHLSDGNEYDTAQAAKLKDLPGVSVHTYEGTTHTVGRVLKKQGKIPEMLKMEAWL